MAPTISRQKLLREWRLYFFVVPSLVMVLTFAYFPAASAVYHSFFDWSGGDAKQFISWDNFKRAATDQTLINSFVTVGALMVFNLFKMIPSILLAVLIHRLFSARWQYAYRALLVVPMIVPQLVTLFIWKFILDPNLGVLNRLIDFTGFKTVLVGINNFFGWSVFFDGVPIGWLSQPELILPALFIWGFPWIGTVGVLIYLAGLQAIGQEIYEAAELDGIGPIKKFIYIELPLILTQIRLSLVLLIVGTLSQYGLILLLLNEYGGPGGRGMVPGLWMYNRAFVAGEFGYACAIGIILFAVILGLTLINNRYVRVEK
ncbi:MAG: sugar ABC transporter permease [Opitutaceae bacterium]|nr:sugar ABC transporter permease [Opitutaceae bacterium]MBP9914071.1 sugar ABC transporter permease [Opitutaceae bacterium]